MEDADFSNEFCIFIQSSVPSVDAAELLLLVAAHPDQWWNVTDVLGKLDPATTVGDSEAARYFELFASAGLAESGADSRIRDRPVTGTHDAHVKTLADAYKERPVTLIRMIYALRDTNIRSFADAFRLRKR
jgi:hypothetical protein